MFNWLKSLFSKKNSGSSGTITITIPKDIAVFSLKFEGAGGSGGSVSRDLKDKFTVGCNGGAGGTPNLLQRGADTIGNPIILTSSY